MYDNFVSTCTEAILRRLRQDGGFALNPNGIYRPDATAWAILALSSVGDEDRGIIKEARFRLKKDQEPDGRLTIQKGFSAAYWPTALAALAWNKAPEFKEAYKRSIDFLLSVSGHSFSNAPHIGHDTTLRGWPWIEGTHSWVEPTALAFLALKRAGMTRHDRFDEALRLMLNRQLPKGGWNYGNTTIFGQELRPIPYSTGMLLYSLAGTVDRSEIQNSLDYIERRIQKDRTPLSLGWGILGFRSWVKEPFLYKPWLMECLRMQERYGEYNTCFLSIILLAYASLKEATQPF